MSVQCRECGYVPADAINCAHCGARSTMFDMDRSERVAADKLAIEYLNRAEEAERALDAERAAHELTQAGAAAMRAAIATTLESCGLPSCGVCNRARAAIATDTGRAMLDELERLRTCTAMLRERAQQLRTLAEDGKPHLMTAAEHRYAATVLLGIAGELETGVMRQRVQEQEGTTMDRCEHKRVDFNACLDCGAALSWSKVASLESKLAAAEKERDEARGLAQDALNERARAVEAESKLAAAERRAEEAEGKVNALLGRIAKSEASRG